MVSEVQTCIHTLIVMCTYLLQICLALALHRRIVAIPKSVHPVRISENLQATEIKLDEEDIKQLRLLDKNVRLLKGTSLWTSNFTAEDLWDTKKDELFDDTLDGRDNVVF